MDPVNPVIVDIAVPVPGNAMRNPPIPPSLNMFRVMTDVMGVFVPDKSLYGVYTFREPGVAHENAIFVHSCAAGDSVFITIHRRHGFWPIATKAPCMEVRRVSPDRTEVWTRPGWIGDAEPAPILLDVVDTSAGRVEAEQLELFG